MLQRKVSFGEAIRMAIVENYCNFDTRSSRSEFWWYSLFQFLLSCALVAVFGYSNLSQALSGIVSLALLLPSLGLTVRRLHDIGKSGWWIFIVLIPLVGEIILIVWLCQPSIPVENQYGPVPNLEAREY